jgi:2-oxoglutarate dehydrogenase E2 component (dihydrolipoamide succinyltransferase)
MTIDIRIPAVGESIQEALLAQWFRQDGEQVHKDDLLFVVETDKVTLEVAAEADGILRIRVPAGRTVAVGTIVGTLEAAAVIEQTAPAKEVTPAPAPAQEEQHPAREPAPRVLAPSVRRLVSEKGLNASRIAGTGPRGRITKGDVLHHLAAIEEEGEARVAAAGEMHALPAGEPAGADRVTRTPMTPIRRRIAQRLVEARQQTAMLTTFNEIDMSRVQELRSRFKEAFREKYGVSLGIMSFFIRATVAALREYPEVNASIDGDEIVHHHYHDIGVAIGAERGLVVPVIRHAEGLGFAGLEQAIVDYVRKIRENKLELSDLEGGTFTITNGGVYGSLLSTPILNPPQSGILGMHKIEDRPVAVAGQVVIRPMMYVALSYDHRIIDGRQAVSFLRHIKECIEHPERLLLEI